MRRPGLENQGFSGSSEQVYSEEIEPRGSIHALLVHNAPPGN